MTMDGVGEGDRDFVDNRITGYNFINQGQCSVSMGYTKVSSFT